MLVGLLKKGPRVVMAMVLVVRITRVPVLGVVRVVSRLGQVWWQVKPGRIVRIRPFVFYANN